MIMPSLANLSHIRVLVHHLIEVFYFVNKKEKQLPEARNLLNLKLWADVYSFEGACQSYGCQLAAYLMSNACCVSVIPGQEISFLQIIVKQK